MRRNPIEVIYSVLLLALPPAELRRADREEMSGVLLDQLANASSAWARLRIGGRAIRRLPGVVAMEWLDWLGVTGPATGPSGRNNGEGMMLVLLRNLAFAGRSLRKAPAFSISSVLLVALGVGTVTTAFTVVDHVLLRPLPYPGADRLVYMTNGSHNGPTLQRLDGVAAFDLWTATSANSVNMTRVDGDPLRLRRIETTPDFFTMLGARPHLGRLLVGADRDNLEIAVLSYPFWRDVLGADPDVVGTTMRIDGEPIEIVGVLSDSFVPPSRLGDEAQFYRPVDWSREEFLRPGYHAHSVTARLAPGVTLEQANDQIDRVAADVAAAHADYYSDEPPNWPLESLHATTVEDVRTGLLMLLGAVGMLLLVACANVAHLFMARGLSRAREMSIRRAMGARPWNLLVQLSAESLVVGLAGGAGGLLIAQLALGFFRRWTVQLPRGIDVTLDPRVFLACIGLATTTAFVFGLLPAFRTIGSDVQVGLRAGGRGVSGGRGVQAFRSGLVIFEVAMSLVLVASAGLLMRSFMSVTAVDPGLVTENVWMLPLNPTNVETPEDYGNRMELVRRAILAVPGVASANYGIEAPFQYVGGDGCCWSNAAVPPGEPEANPVRLQLHPVSEGFFQTYSTELVAGGVWSRSEAGASPTPVVISEALAVRFFGAADAALGREIDAARGIVVAGVAEQTRHYGLDQDHEYAVYLPVEALPFPINNATFAIKAAEPSEAFARLVREAVWSEEPNLPVPSVTPLETWVEDSSAIRRFGSLLLGTFGAIALLLAAAGLYGTLLYAVGQRRQELGIRIALGAGSGQIQKEVIRKGVVHAASGILIGGIVAVFVGRLLESWLFGVSATDPIALTSAALVLFLTAVAASWFPAYRAGKIDPLETLNAE